MVNPIAKVRFFDTERIALRKVYRTGIANEERIADEERYPTERVEKEKYAVEIPATNTVPTTSQKATTNKLNAKEIASNKWLWAAAIGALLLLNSK